MITVLSSLGKRRREEARMRGSQTDIPALSYDDAKKKGNEDRASAEPAVGCVGGGFVEVALVYLRNGIGQH